MDGKVPPSDSSISLPPQASFANNTNTSTSGMSVEEKFKIVRSTGDECTREDELMKLLAEKPQPICYIRVEPWGRMHIAQGVMMAINVNKLISAGCHVKIWLADWFAQLNNKLNGDLKKIRVFTEYMIEIWKVLGMKMDEGLEFLWSLETIQSRAYEYWPLVMDIARVNDLDTIKGCYPGHKKKDDLAPGHKEEDDLAPGHKKEDDLTAAQIFYPCMDCADVFFLKADICLLGMDQLQVKDLARGYCDDIKRENKPIILSHHMLPSLVTVQEKMPKSALASAIFMEDEEADVNVKIKKAYCPPNVLKDNPCLEYIKYIVLPWQNKFKVERSAVNGGEKTYHNFEDIAMEYESGLLHPADLKSNLSKALNQILKPVRDHFKEDVRAKDLLKRVKGFKITS